MNKPSLSWWCGWQGSDGFQEHYESYLLEIQFICMDTEVLKAKCFTILGWTLFSAPRCLSELGTRTHLHREMFCSGFILTKAEAITKKWNNFWFKKSSQLPSPNKTPAQEISDTIIKVTEVSALTGRLSNIWGLQKVELGSLRFQGVVWRQDWGVWG